MYVAPLRCAVLWLAESPYRWDDQSVASLAHVSPRSASAYCGQLSGIEVLEQHDDGCYRKAWAWQTWATRTPRTRPGGNSRDYRDAYLERLFRYPIEQQRRRELGARIREARIARGWGIVRLASEAKVGHKTVCCLESGKWTPEPAIVDRIGTALGVELWVP